MAAEAQGNRGIALLANPRVPLILGGVIVSAAAIAALTGLLLAPQQPITLREPVTTVVNMPPDSLAAPEPELERPRAERKPPAIGEAEPTADAPPLEPLPELLQASEFGMVPRIDGALTSWAAYRREPRDLARDGRISILVLDLGLDPETTIAAASLPADVSLSFSPYGDDTAEWMRFARWRGHEVLLNLPLEPRNYPRRDPGPATLFPDWTAVDLAAMLTWLMAQGQGYVGFAGAPETFDGSDPASAFIVEMIGSHGLGFVELDDQRFRRAAGSSQTPYLSVPSRLDATLVPEAIDQALDALAAEAIGNGFALAYTRPYPLIFEKISAWSQELEAKGLTLAALTSFETSVSPP